MSGLNVFCNFAMNIDYPTIFPYRCVFRQWGETDVMYA